MVKEVADKKEFDREVAQGKVVVDFFATWCGPCVRIAPEVVKLAEIHKDVKFLKVDVDKAGDVAQAYQIQAMPTFKFFINGVEVKELEVVGASVEKIKSSVEGLKKK